MRLSARSEDIPLAIEMETGAMTTRQASCGCGQLRVTCEGDPVRISICHCLECQKRTGSVFGTQARFPREKVKVEGRSTPYTRVADSGSMVTSHFCPGLRLNRLLGACRISRCDRHCGRHVRRSRLSTATHLRLRGPPAFLGAFGREPSDGTSRMMAPRLGRLLRCGI